MRVRTALRTIFVVSLVGIAFSGTLTYQELWGAGATASCPAPGAPGTLFGYPACVYGFFMYLLIAALAYAGMRAES